MESCSEKQLLLPLPIQQPPPGVTVLLKSQGSFYFAAWSPLLKRWYDVGGKRWMEDGVEGSWDG
jgi:hypothetical protein